MATVEQLHLTVRQRQNRYFSEQFKQKKVHEIDKLITSVAEVCREYEVSRTSVYKWIYKFSLMRKKTIRTVVESKSDTTKIKALKDQIEQLEKLLGQKQFQIDFLEKQMEIASDELGIDLKKKLSSNRLPGSGKTGKNTSTK